MAIPNYVTQRFDTMLRAARNDDLACLECADAKTGEPRYVICAVEFDGAEYEMVPFGHVSADENPYDAYIPPTTEEESHGT